MRPTVKPPDTTHCLHCGGELRLKTIEESNPTLSMDVEILVCVSCGHEHTITFGHDQHSAKTNTTKSHLTSPKHGD